MNKRPIAVTPIAVIYILTGVAAAADHLIGFRIQHPFQYDILWVEIVSLIAILCGAFMLRGCNWARWLAIAWIAFHVALTAFHTLPELAIHSLFLAVIAYFLLRPEAGRYFRKSAAGAQPSSETPPV